MMNDENLQQTDALRLHASLLHMQREMNARILKLKETIEAREKTIEQHETRIQALEERYPFLKDRDNNGREQQQRQDASPAAATGQRITSPPSSPARRPSFGTMDGGSDLVGFGC